MSVALVALVAVAAIGSGVAVAADPEIKLGFTPPVTGGSAAEGALQLKAIKLALKEINAAGGVNGKKINLIVVDNQSSNPGALTALQKAVEQEKVLIDPRTLRANDEQEVVEAIVKILAG